MRLIAIACILLLGLSSGKTQTINDINFGTDQSLEVVSWNIQFFPLNGDVTVNNVSSLIQAIDADIFAIQEVSEVNEFEQMIENIAGYDAFVSSTDDWVKLAYVYKTDNLEVSAIYEIFTNEEYWLPFTRRPLVMEFSFQGDEIVVINNHFKALGDGVLDPEDPMDEENRRLAATTLLKEYIDTNFPNDDVIVLGDLNDVLTDEPANNVFQPILDDAANYAFADQYIAIGDFDDWSYPDWPSHIDHIIISNELFDEFYAHSSSVTTLKPENYLPGGWSEYSQDISDHRPVAIKLFPDETLLFNKDFNDQSLSSGGWTNHTIVGNLPWNIPDIPFGNNSTYCAAMSGFNDGFQETETWLVSPVFAPDDYQDLRFSFWNTSGFTGPPLEVFWSNNYSGDPQTAIWTPIEGVNWHDGEQNWVWTFSGILDLSYLTGNSAHIAFRYTSNTQGAATWELDDILLSNAGNVHFIDIAVNPPEAGTVSGEGTFFYGEIAECTAVANDNFEFVNWTVNDEVVSTDQNYSFTVTGSRNLQANFSQIVRIENPTLTRSLVAYPNPVSSVLFVRVDEGFQIQERMSIFLMDHLGKIHPLQYVRVDEGLYRLDLTAVPSGVYTLRVDEGDKGYSRTAVVVTR